MQKINVQRKSIHEIKPYWRNPRDNEPAVAAVEASIREFGYCQPILVDEEMVIVAGHTRYKALQRLNVQEVDVIVADHLTPEQAREYRIIDNKTSELAEWDQSKLIPELRAFRDLDSFAVHFPEIKLDKIDMPSVGSSAAAAAQVTDEEIEEKHEEMQNTFKDAVEERKLNVKTFTCPHCMMEFDTTS